MQVIMTILYIILFILCLSVLIVVHELGHLGAAKFFKIYCKEFSIGFGPALIHKRKVNGETYFSLRAIPFGGYVSMYGEAGKQEIDEEFKDVDPLRAFTAAKKWKRVIVLFAGVFNNCILALILFFISNQCFIQKNMYINAVNVASSSIAETAGIQDGSLVVVRKTNKEITDADYSSTNSQYYTLDKEAILTYEDSHVVCGAAVLDTKNLTYTVKDYASLLKIYQVDNAGKVLLANEIPASSTGLKSVTFNVTTYISEYKQVINNEWKLVPKEEPASKEVGIAYIQEGKLVKWDGSNWKETSYVSAYTAPTNYANYDIWQDIESIKTPHAISLNVSTNSEDKKVFQDSGMSLFYFERWNSFGESVKGTFTDFGKSATAIVRALGGLFTSAENWQNVGGIIAIGVQTTDILTTMGGAKFIYVWGLISVNLAIMNLLPFPGLDGWQILVIIVEAIAHKDIPEKVKNTISAIGIALLFVLMIFILIKDIIGLF